MSPEEIEQRKKESRARKVANRPMRIKEKRRDTLRNIKYLKDYRKRIIDLTLDPQKPKYSWINPQHELNSYKERMKSLIGTIMADLYFMDRIYLHKILRRYFKRTFF